MNNGFYGFPSPLSFPDIIDVKEFDSSGTYVVPPNANRVYIACVAPGTGGGGGARGLTAQGGGGGFGGYFASGFFSVAQLSTPTTYGLTGETVQSFPTFFEPRPWGGQGSSQIRLLVVIGAGGVGGAGATADNSDGSGGSIGSKTTVYSQPSVSDPDLVGQNLFTTPFVSAFTGVLGAIGGSNIASGSTTRTSQGYSVVNGVVSNDNFPTSQSTSTAANRNITASNWFSTNGAAGGGCTGGVGTTGGNIVLASLTSIAVSRVSNPNYPASSTGETVIISGGLTGQNGQDSTGYTISTRYSPGLGGGGGGGGEASSPAGNGGNGWRGGGGGGGGGANNGQTAGRGGNGGNGYALIIAYA